jgi:type VI secretion system Hcp family effector
MKLFKTLVRFLVFALLAIATSPASAAFNAYAELTLNGSAVTGDVSNPTVGGDDVSQNHIEIFEYRQNVSLDKTGTEVKVSPVTLLKKSDAATPVFIQALIENQTVEGVIKFYTVDRFTGATKLDTTVGIVDGRIIAVKQRQPNVLDDDVATLPNYELIKIEAAELIFTDVESGSSASVTPTVLNPR